MASFKSLTLAAVLLSTSISLTLAASATCIKLASSSTIAIEYPLSPAYTQDQSLYWSTACSILLPSCILVPKNASEVSTIITTLLTNSEKFAVKSGGHNPNPTFSSVDGGPLINLKGLNEVTYNAQSGTVRVGPGNRWADVAKALEPFNVTVVGGRIGHVGVGGYLVGGGLSYLSTQYGWAVDTVVEFEVVLANGTIVTATSSKNVDLFNVLRGGGNAFGIVTTYTMKAFPMGAIWGGQLIFTSAQSPQVLAAVRNFTENYPSDKAAIIATNEIALSNLANIWLIFVFYDGEVLPPGTFDAFTDIGPLTNTLSQQSYYSFLSSFDAFVLMGTVYTITTETSPLPNATAGPEVLGSYHDFFTSTVMSQSAVPGLSATMALQPLPRRLAAKARANGGDLLDLDDGADRLLMEFDFSYQFPSSKTAIDPAVSALFTGVRDRVLGFVGSGKVPDVYVPLFMNDANSKQDYFGRLRPEKKAYAARVRDAVDPGNLFRDRTGGFKI